MNTYRLASYSAKHCLDKSGRKVSGSAIKQAIKDGKPIDLEITSMFDKDCGRMCSPSDLKARGESTILVRFNADRDIVSVKL